MNLSPHFTLEEFTHSDTATRLGIDNNVPYDSEIMRNLHRTVETMEIVRTILRNPVIISSGYRSKELNKRIGGSPTSAHTMGLASDFRCPGFGNPKQVAIELSYHKNQLGFDQLIYEGDWVHLGLTTGAPRGQIMTATFRNGKAHYDFGIT